jgi:hypothetical protein
MTAFSVLAPGRPRDIRLLGIDWHDLQGSANHKEIELASSGLALPALDNDSGFKYCCGRDEPSLGGSNRREKGIALRFHKENRRQS